MYEWVNKQTIEHHSQSLGFFLGYYTNIMIEESLKYGKDPTDKKQKYSSVSSLGNVSL